MSAKYQLKTVDGRQIAIDVAVSAQSGYIKSLFQDFPGDSGAEQSADLVHELCTFSVMERIVSWMTKTHEMTTTKASAEASEQYNRDFFNIISPDPATPSEILYHILVV